jgi:hypothetical protein
LEKSFSADSTHEESTTCEAEVTRNGVFQQAPRARSRSSSATASKDGRGDLINDRLPKPRRVALEQRGVDASTRKAETTNEAANSALLTPFRENYQKREANALIRVCAVGSTPTMGAQLLPSRSRTEYLNPHPIVLKVAESIGLSLQ